MCGIVGLHLRDPELYPRLGSLLEAMLAGATERGPDAAGIAVYGDRERCPEGHAAVSLLGASADPAADLRRVLPDLSDVTVRRFGVTTVITAPVDPDALATAVRAAAPEATVVGIGTDLVVYKDIGDPLELAASYDIGSATGWQALAHTRMATESAITPEGSHPFSVGPDQCLVHNGSFSNHATIRRALRREGIEFDSENDTEVAARFVAACLADGDGLEKADLEKALHRLGEAFDGFYTLLVTTADGFAVVRDEIACKPAIVADHPRWVAMASEFRSLAVLPGLSEATIFEPEPGKVYAWQR